MTRAQLPAEEDVSVLPLRCRSTFPVAAALPQRLSCRLCASAAPFMPSLRFRSAFTSAGVCRTAVTGRRHDIGGSSWPHCPDPAPVQPPGTLPPQHSHPQAKAPAPIRLAPSRAAHVNTSCLRPDSLRQYASPRAGQPTPICLTSGQTVYANTPRGTQPFDRPAR